MNEIVIYRGKQYRLSDTSKTFGATVIKLLEAGFTIDFLIESGNLVPFEAPSTIAELLDATVKMVRCSDPLCSECHPPPATETLTLKVDTSAVNEAIQQVLNVSQTTSQLIRQLAERDAHGKAKYGTSLDRTDLSLVDWLQHQTEELLDGAGYAQAAKREAERLLRIEEPLRKLIDHLQENPPRIHNPSLRALVDLLQ